MNSDASTLLPHLNSNTSTDIYIYILADMDIGLFGFRFHISIPTAASAPCHAQPGPLCDASYRHVTDARKDSLLVLNCTQTLDPLMCRVICTNQNSQIAGSVSIYQSSLTENQKNGQIQNFKPKLVGRSVTERFDE
jgi:hypothetical protein